MKPNFLVAGVAKAGTTSLFYYLRQHPEISIPRKETFYFIHRHYLNPHQGEPGARPPERIVHHERDYLKLYANCHTKAIGEISTGYAYYYTESIPEIKRVLGDPRIILVLRNPVERLISGYNHFRNAGLEPYSLPEAIAHEEKRREAGWDFMWQYTGLGFYADAVRAYQENFSQVMVILQEDLMGDNTLPTLKKLAGFLGVDTHFSANVKTKYNISDSQDSNPVFRYVLRNVGLRTLLKPLVRLLIPTELKRKILHRLRKRNPGGKYKPDSILENNLRMMYADDIRSTQALIGRDLSHWLRTST